MTFDEAIDLLDRWNGRAVCAAVRTPPDGRPTLVAVLRGALGAVETSSDGPGGPDDVAAFVPIRVSDSPPLGETVGLQLDRDTFEGASGDPAHLRLRLSNAAVDVASK
jgi:hypothetical protein